MASCTAALVVCRFFQSNTGSSVFNSASSSLTTFNFSSSAFDSRPVDRQRLLEVAEHDDVVDDLIRFLPERRRSEERSTRERELNTARPPTTNLPEADRPPSTGDPQVA